MCKQNRKQSDQTQRAYDDYENQAFEISGTVGTLLLESQRIIRENLKRQISYAIYQDITDLNQLDFGSKKFYFAFPNFLIIVVVVIVIIGGLSGFYAGSNTQAQRV